jgi:hypothetical protein
VALAVRFVTFCDPLAAFVPVHDPEAVHVVAVGIFQARVTFKGETPSAGVTVNVAALGSTFVEATAEGATNRIAPQAEDVVP